MGNVTALSGTPTAALRQALLNLLHEGSFRFDMKTRGLISQAEKALRVTDPQSKAVGLYWYDKQTNSYEPVSEAMGLDAQGNPRPGCTFLLKQ